MVVRGDPAYAAPSHSAAKIKREIITLRAQCIWRSGRNQEAPNLRHAGNSHQMYHLQAVEISANSCERISVVPCSARVMYANRLAEELFDASRDTWRTVDLHPLQPRQ